MITYPIVYPDSFYYLLRNIKQEAICIIRVEDKEKYKYLFDEYNFKITKGKDI